MKVKTNEMTAIILNYFSSNVEFKVKRATVIMIPVIIICSLIAYIVNH